MTSDEIYGRAKEQKAITPEKFQIARQIPSQDVTGSLSLNLAINQNPMTQNVQDVVSLGMKKSWPIETEDGWDATSAALVASGLPSVDASGDDWECLSC